MDFSKAMLRHLDPTLATQSEHAVLGPTGSWQRAQLQVLGRSSTLVLSICAVTRPQRMEALKKCANSAQVELLVNSNVLAPLMFVGHVTSPKTLLIFGTIVLGIYQR